MPSLNDDDPHGMEDMAGPVAKDVMSGLPASSLERLEYFIRISTAQSLKRIADALEKIEEKG